MGLIALVLYWLLQAYFFVLIGRFVFDLVLSVNRDWRPRGLLLVLVEVIYTLTDAPLKLVRRLVPPLRFGGLQFDFGWTLLLGAVLFAERLVTLIG